MIFEITASDDDIFQRSGQINLDIFTYMNLKLVYVKKYVRTQIN